MKGAALEELRHALAENLVRSRLDTTDGLLMLTAFLHDLRWDRAAATADELAARWRDLAADPPRGHFFNLSIHFPFCAQRCLFCFFGSKVPHDPKALVRWVPETAAELRHFAAPLEGATFRRFTVGGGTPSLLDERALEETLGSALRLFRFEDGASKSIECNPASADPSKLRLLRRLGFDRVSFGVQSLDPTVLRLIRREYQDYASVRSAVREARAAGFADVNLDLLFGLVGDRLETFLEGFRRTAGLRPETLTVCGLTLTDGYLRAMKTTRSDFGARYQAALGPALAGLRREAVAAGYRTDESAPERGLWTFVRGDVPAETSARWTRGEDQGADPCSILGIGAGSRSHLFSRLLCQRREGAFGAGVPLYRVATLTRKEEMALYLLYALENGPEAKWAEFESRFGSDVREEFALELSVLAAWDRLAVTPTGFRFLGAEPAARAFYGQVFLLETLARRGGLLDAELLRRLRKELKSARLAGSAA